MKNQIKSSKNYGKYYAHTIRRGEVKQQQIEERIQANSSAKASDVRLVLRELFDTIRDYLQDGYVVNLEEMGKFSLSVKSTCVKQPSDFMPSKHIKGFKCNYTPQGHRYKVGEGRLAGHIKRHLLDGCQAIEAPYYPKEWDG
jgi:predicted histone-like DNA-binding protein